MRSQSAKNQHDLKNCEESSLNHKINFEAQAGLKEL